MRTIALSATLKKAKPILQALSDAGYEAVFVGGAVRDSVLGLPIKDVDIATSATPEQVVNLFPKCIPTGLQHGTVTVLHGGESYEVTTYRKESAYEGHRRPEAVQYITELNEDMQRRDFTINAMALTADGELIDYFDGYHDICNGVLRCVGDANARFQEDALRMLRAVRFIAVYEYRPTYTTWKALVRHRKLMQHIAMERVQAELDKIVAASMPERALRWLSGSGLLQDLKEPLPLPDEIITSQSGSQLCWRQYRDRFKGLHSLTDVDLRWGAVCMELGLAQEAAQGAMKRLRFSNERKARITELLQINAELAVTNQDKLREKCIMLLVQYGKVRVQEWARAKSANLLNTKELDQIQEYARVWETVPITTLKELNVNGRELIKHLNRSSDPWVSKLLYRLLYAVAAGELGNEREELLEQARIWSEK